MIANKILSRAKRGILNVNKKARLKNKEFATAIAPEAASEEASLAQEGREPTVSEIVEAPAEAEKPEIK